MIWPMILDLWFFIGPFDLWFFFTIFFNIFIGPANKEHGRAGAERERKHPGKALFANDYMRNFLRMGYRDNLIVSKTYENSLKTKNVRVFIYKD